MIWIERLNQFSMWDFIALACFILGWLWIGWRIENPRETRPSVSYLMANFRRDWMQEMVCRNPRIFDSQVISSLRQATAFFASATMVALGAGLALVGDTDQLAGVAQDLALETSPEFVWEIKILVVLAFLTNAFLGFVWSHRLFGYCSVLMAAVPNDPEHPRAYPRARQAAEINITAARSFNRGLRSTYFALAGLAWLVGPEALILATVITLGVLYRREFVSRSRRILMQSDANTPVPAAPGPQA
ncbi:DUF599 domain-containing protein [Tritonibacter horizontis]|uniref:DUF599 domain-containing protein n=1 Tax=Tritonibacter horizontis TaxID=1768241 RepID=A0A132BTJ1_9RHOB|nr:DUF599 domain-containing protein [Tritonibacter horizontis]KUP91526.1 hypothetical protein TRIHO_36900 [Tritonibacter horizontis]